MSALLYQLFLCYIIYRANITDLGHFYAIPIALLPAILPAILPFLSPEFYLTFPTSLTKYISSKGILLTKKCRDLSKKSL